MELPRHTLEPWRLSGPPPGCRTGVIRPSLPYGPAMQKFWLITLRIHHRTSYRYRRPVTLGPHRVMLGPRESRDLRLISCDLVVKPAAVTTWAQDVFGNAVATATFKTMADIY